MSEFINTIDALGDDVVLNSYIDMSITEFKDDVLTSLPSGSFERYPNLITLDLPNVTSSGIGYDYTMAYNTSLINVNLPKLTTLSVSTFQGCTALEFLDLPSLSGQVSHYTFSGCSKLKALVFRNSAVVSVSGGIGMSDPIRNCAGHIYVPRSLIDAYKSHTHWSTYANQFRAIEDYTVDGTVTGEIRKHTQSIALDATELTFTDANTQTLTATGVLGVLDPVIWKSSDPTVVSVTSGVVKPNGDGTATITATSGDYSVTCAVTVNAGLTKRDVMLVPYNGLETNNLTGWKLDVTAGQTLEITYYVTKAQGYIYDGRQCGLSYLKSGHVLNTDTTITITIPSDGYITFSKHNNDSSNNGEVSTNLDDALYGKYLYVDIV